MGIIVQQRERRSARPAVSESSATIGRVCVSGEALIPSASTQLRVIASRLILAITFATASLHAEGPYYIDSAAVGSNNGSSWGDAWRSFADINWASVSAGANRTIYLSGGDQGKTYSEQLRIGAMGSAESYVKILPGSASPHPSNHSGLVTFTTGGLYACIIISEKAFVEINGDRDGTPNIRITRCEKDGIYVYGSVHHIVIANLEVDNNGLAETPTGPNGIYANLAATNPNTLSPILDIRRNKVHANYQDNIVIVGDRGPATFDRILIHDNEIYDQNDDSITAGPRGISIYNNVMHGRDDPIKGKGHPDGIEAGGGYLKIYNNFLYDIQHPTSPTNSYIQPGFIGGSTITSECCSYTYNNIILHRGYVAGDYVRGIELSLTDPNYRKLDDIGEVVIANNTIVGVPFAAMLISTQRKDVGAPITTMSGKWYIVNNIIRDVGVMGGALNLGRTGEMATYGSWNADVNVIFDFNSVSNSQRGSTGVMFKGAIFTYPNFRAVTGMQGAMVGTRDPELDQELRPLLSSWVIDAGVGMDRHFQRDRLGILRPQGSAWDLGAFEFFSNQQPIPRPPLNLNISTQ